MKKVLVAFDGSHYSEGALEFARQLNARNPILLTGDFLPKIDYASLWSQPAEGKPGSSFIPLLEDEDSRAVQENIKRFETYCLTNKIEFKVHKDFFDFALPELKNESRFADLLLLSSERFYEQAGTSRPNDYLKEALYKVECPVVIVPEKFDFPVHNILAYDGKPESVYAIKQFAYLFPELTGNETLLIYINDKGNEEIPEQINIEELAGRHFSKLTLNKLEMNPKKNFVPWLMEKKGAILISGSFGGSLFSHLFHKSFVFDIIREHRVPVFIAHK